MRRLTFAAILAIASSLAIPVAGRAAAPTSDWPMYGHDVGGARENPDERVLSPARVARGLRVQWRLRTAGPVYGTPAAVDTHVYAADATGHVYAVERSSGRPVWVSRVGPVAAFPLVVTGSPLVTEKDVIVGDQNGTVWALDRRTGVVRWLRRPNTFGYPAIYGSPALAIVRTATGPRRLVLVGVASNEETYTVSNSQPCCSSRGSLAALDPRTGRVVWQTYMVSPTDAARGAAGASIWSTPVYDRELNRIYVTTGNNFGDRAGVATTPTAEAIVSLDAATGRIVWANQRTPDDTWSYAYRGFSPGHQDFDFGDSAKVFRLSSGRKVVAAGQKSGFLHVLDAATGEAMAQKQLLPGGGLGGLFSDSAQAGGVVFADGNDWTSFGGGELGAVAGSPPPRAGSVVAVRADQPGSLQELWRFSTPGSPMLSGVAAANGIVYVHASRDGGLYALSAATGKVLARLPVGIGLGGPSIAGGRIYLGVGDVSGMAGSDPTGGAVLAVEPLR